MLHRRFLDTAEAQELKQKGKKGKGVKGEQQDARTIWAYSGFTVTPFPFCPIRLYPNETSSPRWFRNPHPRDRFVFL
jgi:hypothetical protein